MDKKPMIGVCIWAVVLLVLASSTNVVGYQTIQLPYQKTITTYDDVDIDIYAGVYGMTDGNYGLGFVIDMTNNLDKNVKADVQIYYNNTQNKTVSYTNVSIVVPYFLGIKLTNIDWFHFPYTKLTFKITVDIKETSQTVSRSGTEIGPFVFFS